MMFWRITLKRSVHVSKTYVILGIFMAIYGILLSNILPLLIASSPQTVNSPIDLTSVFPILSVAFLPLSALFVSMPVLTLFIVDKNNGVFEYLLSTGLDQLDIFKGYVKASLMLATYLLIFATILNAVIGILLQTNLTLIASISALIFSIGISVVFLVTVSMIAFSALQKTPTGANSPLGTVIGVIPVFPSLILPIVFPAYALIVDIAIAAITIVASLGLLLSIGRLIQREKLLP